MGEVYRAQDLELDTSLCSTPASSSPSGRRRRRKCESHDLYGVGDPYGYGNVLPPGVRIGDRESGGWPWHLNLCDHRSSLLVPRPKDRSCAPLAAEQERRGDQQSRTSGVGPGVGNFHAFQPGVRPDRLRCVAMGHLPQAITRLQVDRNDATVGRLEERKSEHCGSGPRGLTARVVIEHSGIR